MKKIPDATVELADAMTRDEVDAMRDKMVRVQAAQEMIRDAALNQGVSADAIENAPSWKAVMGMMVAKKEMVRR